MYKQLINKTISKDIYTKCGIYLIEISHHKYVGSSKNIYIRLQEHRKTLRKNKHANIKFQNIYNKYQESEIYISILEICEEKNLLEKEKF